MGEKVEEVGAHLLVLGFGVREVGKRVVGGEVWRLGSVVADEVASAILGPKLRTPEHHDY